MDTTEYLYVAFATTADAMYGESLLQVQSIPGRLVLIPREITAGCGMAWRTQPDQAEAIESILKDHMIQNYQLVIL